MTTVLAILLVMAVLALVGTPWWPRRVQPELTAGGSRLNNEPGASDQEIMESVRSRYCAWCGGRREPEEGAQCPHCGRNIAAEPSRGGL